MGPKTTTTGFDGQRETFFHFSPEEWVSKVGEYCVVDDSDK